MFQNQLFFIAHGGSFRLGGFRSGRVMLRLRDVERLNFYIIRQMRFPGWIERNGLGGGLLRCFRGKQMRVALILVQ